MITEAPSTGRVQLALDVADLQTSIDFYSKLLGVGPAKVRAGYANFAVASPPLKLVLLERPGTAGQLNHLGIEVSDSQRVQAEISRLADAGLAPRAENGTCCYALQDKAWATGPDGEQWEVYTVLADAAPEAEPASDPVCC